MLIRWLPLIVGVVPFIGIHFCYAIAIEHGYAQACIPYIDGCTSISATGRYPPANLLFRAIELPVAALLIIVWSLTAQWLKALTPAAGHRIRTAILIAGITGSLALIVYTTFLGTKEPFYEFMRRFGIYLYFLGITLAQLFVTLTLRRARISLLGRIPQMMLWLCLTPFALGVLNLVQKSVLEYATADALENAIEWVASAMLQAWFVLLYLAWRRSGFAITVRADSMDGELPPEGNP
jgi:hypothetical protein